MKRARQVLTNNGMTNSEQHMTPIKKYRFSHMKTKISIVLMTIIIGLMTSCSENDDELYYSVNFTLIAQDNLYGAGEENIDQQNLRISDSNSWNELMDKMNTVNNVCDNFTETTIDFGNFIIIAVFDNIKSHGGHSIDITKIIENENKTITTIDNVLKGNATTVMTQPFHIVKIPKTDKSVIFE